MSTGVDTIRGVSLRPPGKLVRVGNRPEGSGRLCEIIETWSVRIVSDLNLVVGRFFKERWVRLDEGRTETSERSIIPPPHHTMVDDNSSSWIGEWFGLQ